MSTEKDEREEMYEKMMQTKQPFWKNKTYCIKFNRDNLNESDTSDDVYVISDHEIMKILFELKLRYYFSIKRCKLKGRYGNYVKVRCGKDVWPGICLEFCTRLKKYISDIEFTGC